MKWLCLSPATFHAGSDYGTSLCAECHHPQMVIKLANLSQGFLPLAPHLLPSGVWEQRGFSEGSPKPPIKICFPRQIGDCTPKEGEQSRAVLSSVSTINYSGVLWPGWEEMEQHRSRGEYPSQNRETAVCLGGSYCSFTIIFFCKVLNCKKLFFFFVL